MITTLQVFESFARTLRRFNIKLRGTYKFSRRHKSYYITTPVYYVNSVPHIGHLYTAALADTAQRWERLKRGSGKSLLPGDTVVFATGTDEHGRKVYDAARKTGSEPLQYCDNVSERFKDLYTVCNVVYSDFIRTTEQRHRFAVEAFWKLLDERGFIYKGSYEGWYSTPDETFVPEKNTTEMVDKISKAKVRVFNESGHKVEWMQETNYIFRLSAVLDQVKEWVNTIPHCVYPSPFRDRLLSMLSSTIGDISISRERSRVPWGIKTPSDPGQTVYVWLDALINYLTVCGFPDIEGDTFRKTWPADVHLMGVDILKFHAIYWPAFLIAAGLELPKKIIVHSHWLMNGRKMSKSVGNVVDPFYVSEIVTGEGLRYFLLKQGVLEHDCDYSNKLLLQAVNSDLCNTLGNCLNRAVAPKLNPKQIYPAFHKDSFPAQAYNQNGGTADEDHKLILSVRSLPDVVDAHCCAFHFYKAIDATMDCVREANAMIHRNALWKLNLSVTEEQHRCESLMYCVYETLRVTAILFQAFIPDLAQKTLDRLGVPEQERTIEHARSCFQQYDGDGKKCLMRGRKLGLNNGVLIRRVHSSEFEDFEGEMRKSV